MHSEQADQFELIFYVVAAHGSFEKSEFDVRNETISLSGKFSTAGKHVRKISFHLLTKQTMMSIFQNKETYFDTFPLKSLEDSI